MRVVKVGGSLMGHLGETLRVLREHEVLIVPGGGVFAEEVRRAYREHNLSERAAHFMAIAAMDAYGELISDLSGVPARSELRGTLPAVLLPYTLLRMLDPLPHSWCITGDSIACYIAHLLGEKELLILTDVPGVVLGGRVVERIEASELLGMGETCVDPCLPGLLIEYGMRCRVADGRSASSTRAGIEGMGGTLIEPR